MANHPFDLSKRTFFLGGASTLLAGPAARVLAGGQHSPLHFGEALRPEMFGAMGDGHDDTPGLMALVSAVNLAGSGHIVFTRGKTYLLSHHAQKTLYFRNLNGLRIEGHGATLKSRNSGIPTSSLGHNWGQINIDNCQGVQVLGLAFDGNRANQLHTSGFPNFAYGMNFGLNFVPMGGGAHTTSDVQIRGCTFKNLGNLTTNSDILGDGIFMQSGVKRVWVEDNHFENVGRFAFAVAEGAQPSNHIYFRRNTVKNADRSDTVNYPWGAVDIEDHGLDHSHIYIDDNVFLGTTQVTIGGYSLAPGTHESTISDVSISRNRWYIHASGSAANVPFSIGASNPPQGYRTIRRLYVEDNSVIWAQNPVATHFGLTAKLKEVYLRRNIFRSEAANATVDSSIFLAHGGHLEGRIEITDNTFIGMGEALKNGNSWYADPTPEELELRIERNTFDNCFRAFNLQFNTCAAPVGTSKIIFRGNRTKNTRDAFGEYVDGGGLRVFFYDVERHDKIWTHRNVKHS